MNVPEDFEVCRDARMDSYRETLARWVLPITLKPNSQISSSRASQNWSEVFRKGPIGGRRIRQGGERDIYTPVSGEIIEANASLSDNPSLLNTDPYGEGSILKSGSPIPPNSAPCRVRRPIARRSYFK